MNADQLMEKVRARFEWTLYRDVLDEVFRALKKADYLEKRLEAVEARALAKAAPPGQALEDRLTRLEKRVAALARALKGVREAVEALEARVEEALKGLEARAAEDRNLQIARARGEVDQLAPRVFAARGGDADVLVMADNLRARLAQGDLEVALPVLEAWRREVGAG
ncbi:hypothetical protein TthAA37_09520 [Thermus thermophilus]|uniref:Uncharacterized protein n=1 Tax=Thermus thermophilus TaxID=274 RepID=A0AAD1NXZ0_THETH|nr:hypothetical protein [Thermus thermophilus]BCZ86754.1 hypothetical protein TthAA11_09360 [Thermus thermophilus]BCZ89132.1 hypothetical protein TthAA22_09370 [Thermus thermophilus]BCZ91763.1 hypothetical protein TthAA37_09520 [Thermus thermophilus]BCZ94306.1 hypothetical protein TthAK1_09230 [Thermus thermophilus]